MRIVSIRLGFATNSSSSHSVVMNEQETFSREEIARDYRGENGEVCFINYYVTDLSSLVNYVLLAMCDNLPAYKTIVKQATRPLGRYQVFDQERYLRGVESVEGISDDFRQVLSNSNSFIWTNGVSNYAGYFETDDGRTLFIEDYNTLEEFEPVFWSIVTHLRYITGHEE